MSFQLHLELGARIEADNLDWRTPYYPEAGLARTAAGVPMLHAPCSMLYAPCAMRPCAHMSTGEESRLSSLIVHPGGCEAEGRLVQSSPVSSLLRLLSPVY